jgi:hypothetical protein
MKGEEKREERREKREEREEGRGKREERRERGERRERRREERWECKYRRKSTLPRHARCMVIAALFLRAAASNSSCH